MSRCDYQIPATYRTTRACLNGAKWLVEFTTPDDGKSMRLRSARQRCFHHCDEKFLPKGATQIVTSSLANKSADAPTPSRMEEPR